MKIFLFYFTVISGIGSIVTLRNLYYSIVSKKWPSCQAIIIESNFEEKSDIDTHIKRFIPIITYQYVIGDSQYTNDNYNFCNHWLTKSELSQILLDYSVGTKIEIRVNPRKPKVSAIVVGAEFWHYFWVVVCVSFFICLFNQLRSFIGSL